MCGIFGSITPSGLSCDTASLAEKLCKLLHHRGPDDRGWAAFSRSGTLLATEQEQTRLGDEKTAVLLGQTRLSIIDLSSMGHQPMHSEDGRYTLVYNGEIYNYLELRKVLEAQGVRFRSNSDTEVLLYSLIHKGSRCLTEFTGMFAFAFYDAHEQTVLLARDFFGIKPLYYCLDGSALSFASEIPAMLQFPGVEPKLAPQQVYNYLCFGKYDKGGDTFFQNIRQLPPGHLLRYNITSGIASEECYWRPDLEKRSTLSFSDAAECLRELFLDSVKLHLRSDVPLGVALSGGIDSSATTCAVRYLQPETDLHTFSFIAEGSPLSEEPWAKLVANHTRATRHTVSVQPHELVRDLDHMLMALGEPFGSTSIYAQYRVFQLARDNGIKVTLDGQGADELLAGYMGYPGQRIASLLLHGDVLGAWRFFRAKSAWPGVSGANILRLTVREFTPEALLPVALRLVGKNTLPEWLDITAFRDSKTRFTVLDDRKVIYPSRDRVRQTLAAQLTWEGLPQLLRHGDRNAMAFSIESRVPFLTKDLAEFCLSLPEEYLIDMNGRTKSVFREAMRGIVPDATLDRRDKIGFETPEKEWFAAITPWIEETLDGTTSIPYLNLDAARDEWRAVRQNQRPFDRRIWRWLNYTRWARLLEVKA